MSISQPTLASYAAFVGMDEDALPAYVSEALGQATDLMSLALDGEVTADPSDAFQLRVMQRGIDAMAEALMASRPSRGGALLPFRAETIGSYSYEKLINSASTHVPTGVNWFDQAVTLLHSAAEGSSSVSLFEEDCWDSPYSTAREYTGSGGGVQGPKGDQGPAGPQGPQGEPGTAGDGQLSYVHHQSVPLADWTIVHNMGYYPHPDFFDSNDPPANFFIPFTHVDTTTLIAHWPGATSGTATLT